MLIFSPKWKNVRIVKVKEEENLTNFGERSEKETKINSKSCDGFTEVLLIIQLSTGGSIAVKIDYFWIRFHFY